MRLIVAFVALLPFSALAQWSYEFEFGVPFPDSTSRLLAPQCTKVVPVQLVPYYAMEPRSGWEISCGNDVPFYTHWLGRRIGRPLPNLEFEVGWRHFSSPGDHNEIEFDSIGIRGRFQWGKR